MSYNTLEEYLREIKVNIKKKRIDIRKFYEIESNLFEEYSDFVAENKGHQEKEQLEKLFVSQKESPIKLVNVLSDTYTITSFISGPLNIVVVFFLMVLPIYHIIIFYTHNFHGLDEATFLTTNFISPVDLLNIMYSADVVLFFLMSLLFVIWLIGLLFPLIRIFIDKTMHPVIRESWYLTEKQIVIYYLIYFLLLFYYITNLTFFLSFTYQGSPWFHPQIDFPIIFLSIIVFYQYRKAKKSNT